MSSFAGRYFGPKRCLWLDDLYVNPEFRRRGMAKTLMAYRD